MIGQVTLTADLFARAVIAAARAYGDDPVEAMTSQVRGRRRALSAAASGVARMTGRAATEMGEMLGLGKKLISVQRIQGGQAWRDAEAAAGRAVLEALSKPCRDCWGQGGADIRGGPGPCDRCGREGSCEPVVLEILPPVGEGDREAVEGVLQGASAEPVAAAEPRAACPFVAGYVAANPDLEVAYEPRSERTPSVAAQVAPRHLPPAVPPAATRPPLASQATPRGGGLGEELRVAEPPPEPRAPLPPPAGKTRVLTAKRVQAEVLVVLAEDPSTPPELAALIGVAEADVRAALSALSEAGRVTATALTAEGWRAQTWRLADQSSDGAET